MIVDWTAAILQGSFETYAHGEKSLSDLSLAMVLNKC